MKSLNTTSLLSKFVAISGVVGMVGVSANGATINYVIQTVAKETLPTSLALPQIIVNNVPTTGQNASIVLTLQNANYLNAGSYTFLGAGISCSAISSNNSITFIAGANGNCSQNSFVGGSYTFYGNTLNGTPNDISLSLNGNTPIILTYTSNVSNDPISSATLVSVSQQFFMTASSSNYIINPSDLTSFLNGSSGNGSGGCSLSSSTILVNQTNPNSYSTQVSLSTLYAQCPNATLVVSVAGGAGGSDSYASGGEGGDTTLQMSLSNFVTIFGSNASFYYVVGGAGGSGTNAGGGGGASMVAIKNFPHNGGIALAIAGGGGGAGTGYGGGYGGGDNNPGGNGARYVSGSQIPGYGGSNGQGGNTYGTVKGGPSGTIIDIAGGGGGGCSATFGAGGGGGTGGPGGGGTGACGGASGGQGFYGGGNGGGGNATTGYNGGAGTSNGGANGGYGGGGGATTGSDAGGGGGYGGGAGAWDSSAGGGGGYCNTSLGICSGANGANSNGGYVEIYVEP